MIVNGDCSECGAPAGTRATSESGPGPCATCVAYLRPPTPNKTTTGETRTSKTTVEALDGDDCPECRGTGRAHEGRLYTGAARDAPCETCAERTRQIDDWLAAPAPRPPAEHIMNGRRVPTSIYPPAYRYTRSRTDWSEPIEVTIAFHVGLAPGDAVVASNGMLTFGAIASRAARPIRDGRYRVTEVRHHTGTTQVTVLRLAPWIDEVNNRWDDTTTPEDVLRDIAGAVRTRVDEAFGPAVNLDPGTPLGEIVRSEISDTLARVGSGLDFANAEKRTAEIMRSALAAGGAKYGPSNFGTVVPNCRCVISAQVHDDVILDARGCPVHNVAPAIDWLAFSRFFATSMSGNAARLALEILPGKVRVSDGNARRYKRLPGETDEAMRARMTATNGTPGPRLHTSRDRRRWRRVFRTAVEIATDALAEGKRVHAIAVLVEWIPLEAARLATDPQGLGIGTWKADRHDEKVARQAAKMMNFAGNYGALNGMGPSGFAAAMRAPNMQNFPRTVPQDQVDARNRGFVADYTADDAARTRDLMRRIEALEQYRSTTRAVLLDSADLERIDAEFVQPFTLPRRERVPGPFAYLRQWANVRAMLSE